MMTQTLYDQVERVLGAKADPAFQGRLRATHVDSSEPEPSETPVAYDPANERVRRLTSMPSSAIAARSALTLAGQEEVAFGAALLARIVRDGKWMQTAGVGDPQAAGLSKLIDQHQSALAPFIGILPGAALLLQGAIDEPDLVKDVSRVGKTLDVVSALIEAAAKAGLYAKWRTTNLLWKFVCLLRAQNPQAIAEVAKRNQRWQKQFAGDDLLCRWLQEALDRAGSAPKSSGMSITSKPPEPLAIK